MNAPSSLARMLSEILHGCRVSRSVLAFYFASIGFPSTIRVSGYVSIQLGLGPGSLIFMRHAAHSPTTPLCRAARVVSWHRLRTTVGFEPSAVLKSMLGFELTRAFPFTGELRCLQVLFL